MICKKIKSIMNFATRMNYKSCNRSALIIEILVKHSWMRFKIINVISNQIIYFWKISVLIIKIRINKNIHFRLLIIHFKCNPPL